MKSVFEQHTTVQAEILSPIEGKHSVGTSNNPDWASPETAQLMIAAFDVMLAKSATEARRAENEYERLCLLGGVNK